jgi:hypothetical protein
MRTKPSSHSLDTHKNSQERTGTHVNICAPDALRTLTQISNKQGSELATRAGGVPVLAASEVLVGTTCCNELHSPIAESGAPPTAVAAAEEKGCISWEWSDSAAGTQQQQQRAHEQQNSSAHEVSNQSANAFNVASRSHRM